MQSCNNNGEVFFSMDLLKPSTDLNKESVVQSQSAPPLKNVNVSVGVDEEEINITPPDQSNIIIPQNLIFVRKPAREEEIEIEIDEYSEGIEPSAVVSKPVQELEDEEFVYKEPPKLAPVDESLIFIRKPKALEEEPIEFEDADIINDDEPVVDVKLEAEVVYKPEIVPNVVETPIESVVETSEDDTYLADSLAFLGADNEDGDYDFFGFEGLEEEADGADAEPYIEEAVDNLSEEKEKIEDETAIIDSDIIDSDIDGEILYKSEDTKYNENKYRSDNIIRDYEEDNKYNYPLLYLTSETVELFRVQALTGMLDKRSFIDTEELYYHVYVEVEDSVVYLGRLLSKLLRTILNNQTFNTFNKKVYLNKDTSYDGDMLYALSEIDISLLT